MILSYRGTFVKNYDQRTASEKFIEEFLHFLSIKYIIYYSRQA